MSLLALDLGLDCGFAILNDGKFISGTKKLGKYQEKFGERFYEFRKWLLSVIEKYDVKTVYFERVYGHKGVEAGHCFGGFMYTLASVCFQHNIPCISFSVQAIKKFIAGKGNATKEEVIASVRQKGFHPQTDDEADAIAIMLLALDDVKNQNRDQKRYYKALGESGSRPPAISLASEFFRGLTPSNHSKVTNCKKNEISV